MNKFEAKNQLSNNSVKPDFLSSDRETVLQSIQYARKVLNDATIDQDSILISNILSGLKYVIIEVEDEDAFDEALGNEAADVLVRYFWQDLELRGLPEFKGLVDWYETRLTNFGPISQKSEDIWLEHIKEQLAPILRGLAGG